MKKNKELIKYESEKKDIERAYFNLSERGVYLL